MSGAKKIKIEKEYERPNHFAFLNAIREQDELCDVTIKVGNKGIRANKLILAATIDYFRRMFLGNFVESKKDVITIKGINEENMEAIVTFSYTGKIAFTKENAVGMLKDADFFELTDVKDECMEFLKSNLDANNVFAMYHLGESLPDCSSLLDHCKTFIRQNLQDVSLTDDYSNLDFELLESILSGKKDSYEFPEIMFEAIMRWVLKGVASKKTLLPELLRHVNPSYLKPEFLVNSLSKEEFKVIIGPKCSKLVAEILSVYNTLKINSFPENNKTYIYVEDVYDNSVIYDFTTGEWMVNELFLLRPASAAAAHDFRQVVAYKDKLYKFLPKSKSLMNETYIMHVWNFKDKVWTNTEFTVPYDMRGSNVVVLNDCLYACGGRTRNSYYDVWRFSFETSTWQSVSQMKQPRCRPQIVALQEFIYVIGTGSSTVKAMERYDPKTDEWTYVPEFDIKNYKSFAAVGLGDKIYLCGGKVDNEPVALVHVYDLKTNEWTKTASMNTARYDHLVVKYKSKIWAIGGRNANNVELSSIEVYDFVSDSWTYGKPMNGIRGRVTGCFFSTMS